MAAFSHGTYSFPSLVQYLVLSFPGSVRNADKTNKRLRLSDNCLMNWSVVILASAQVGLAFKKRSLT